MKIVLNTCCGIFNLSTAARERYIELSGQRPENWLTIDRTDKFLVQVVEELGQGAAGRFAELAVVDITPGRWYRLEVSQTGVERIGYRDNDADWQIATE